MKRLIISYFTPIIFLALLYFCAAKISIEFLHSDSIVNIGIFASEGIALAFVLFYGVKILPGIFIGQLFFALDSDVTTIASFEIAFINTMEAFIALELLNRLKFNIKLRSFRDIFLLLLIIFFILQPFSALLSNMVLVFHGIITKSSFLNSSFSWWFGNTMGQFLFTPFLLLLFINYKKIDLIKYLSYMFIFGVYIYILEVLLEVKNPLLLLSLTTPIIVFIISLEGFSFGTMMSVVVAVVSSYTVHLEIGPFCIKNVTDNVINYNLFVLAHIAVVLVTGILFQERKKHIDILKETVHLEVEKNREQQLLLLQQSRLAQMGEMIAMIAHQWRQPLNNLSLVNQLLISNYNREKLDDNVIENFKINSKKQIDQMSTTIDDFRNFFQVIKKKEPFSLTTLVKDMLNITKSIYATHGIHIKFHSLHDYIVYGYSNELGQAILNIINNAKDALIDLDIKDKHIIITIVQKENNTLLSISDNAGGISQDIIEKMYDPYFSTKTQKNGTGLGLYMAKIIIEDKLKGKIKFHNTENGAQFDILLQGVTNAT